MFANFAELKAIAAAIRGMKSFDDVELVFDTIRSNKQFHSEYCLNQIHLIVDQARDYELKASRIFYLALEAKLAKALPFYQRFLYNIYFHESCEIDHVSAKGTKTYKDSEHEVIVPAEGDKIVVRKDDTLVATFEICGPQPEVWSFMIIIDRPMIRTIHIESDVSVEIHNIDYVIGDKNDNDVHEAKNEFTDIILKDDLDAFIDLFTSYVAQGKQFPTFETRKALGKSIIEYIALCGSVKCFQYLLVNEHYSETDEIKSAIIEGGSIDIMRMVNFTEWRNPEDFIGKIVSTNNVALFNFWFDNYDISNELLIRHRVIQTCVQSFNLHALETLFENELFTFADEKFRPYYILNNLQVFVQFEGKFTWSDMRHISVELYPMVLPALKIDKSLSLEENTLIEFIKRRLSFTNDQIIAIKEFMYPEGVPLELKALYVDNFKSFQIRLSNDKITLEMLTFMDITPEDTITYTMAAAKGHLIRLLDYILSVPAKYVDVRVYEFLFTSSISIPKVSNHIGRLGYSPKHSELFKVYHFFR